jgi:hypothetical protein
VHEVADRAGEVWISAEARIGKELAKLPKAKGGQPYQKRSTQNQSTGSKTGPVEPTLKEYGVTKKRATRAQKLAAMPEAELEKALSA